MNNRITKFIVLFIIIYAILYNSNKAAGHSKNLLLTLILIMSFLFIDHYIEDNNTPTNCSECVVKENFEDVNDENVNLDEEIVIDSEDFNREYKNYQETEEKKDLEEIKNGNIFKMAVGNQNIVQPYLKNAKNYYDKIYNRSINTPNSTDLLDSELKYSDTSYIGPLNSGMVNPEYTFVAPQNWFPIQPVPPVCVTSEKTITQPLSVVNNHMPYASMNDFNRSRRFTGNMNINIDYIKNVLNDSKTH
jgi:hypothetical protein